MLRPKLVEWGQRLANVDQLWALIGQVVDVVCGSRGAREIQFRSRPDQRGTPAKSGPSPKLESATRSTGVPHLRQNKRRPLSMGGKTSDLGSKTSDLGPPPPPTCPKFLQQSPGEPRFGASSTKSGRRVPEVGHIWPTLPTLCPNRPTLVEHCQSSVEIDQF